MKYDPIIYGKNNTENIVNIDHKDNEIWIFQEINGELYVDVKPASYWILRHTKSKKPGWKTLQGDMHYKYIKEYNNFNKFLGDRSSARRLELDTYSVYDPVEAYQIRYGLTYFKNMKITDVSLVSTDIEATTLKPNHPGAKVLSIANTVRMNGEIFRKHFRYDQYDNEIDMIIDWCNWIREIDPTIIMGYNILGYDIPYLIGRAEVYGYSLQLGRDDSDIEVMNYESKFRKDGSQEYSYHNIKVFGREVCDVMFLIMGWDTIHKKLSNYRLKNVVAELGLEKEGRVHYPAEDIPKKYMIPEEWERICQYNIDDGDDPLTLFDKCAPAYFYLTRSIPKPFQKMCNSCTNTGSQVNAFLVRAYLQQDWGIPKASETRHIKGAISYGVPGLHKNVFKIDLASLYPSIMRQWNVHNAHKDPKNYMIYALDKFTDQRLENKKLAKETGDSHYKDLEQSTKVYLNSNFGMFNAQGLNFNSPDHGEFVTSKGQKILEYSVNWATGKKVTDWGYSYVSERAS